MIPKQRAAGFFLKRITILLRLTTSIYPCYNGRYSQSKQIYPSEIVRLVLTLVLMEDTLRENNITLKDPDEIVLILVLMEDTLRVEDISRTELKDES